MHMKTTVNRIPHACRCKLNYLSDWMVLVLQSCISLTEGEDSIAVQKRSRKAGEREAYRRRHRYHYYLGTKKVTPPALISVMACSKVFLRFSAEWFVYLSNFENLLLGILSTLKSSQSQTQKIYSTMVLLLFWYTFRAFAVSWSAFPRAVILMINPFYCPASVLIKQG
jgi:hypothetical protein